MIQQICDITVRGSVLQQLELGIFLVDWQSGIRS
jgi:hypothetical protein